MIAGYNITRTPGSVEEGRAMKEPQAEEVVAAGDVPETGADNSDILAGDSPPRPVWPLVAGVAVWVVWIGFLLVMMVIRMQITAV